MDTVLQAQFERVEAALSSLVDSIATFNPSTQAAVELVAADDELSSGLDQLSYHQANHTRILALRSEADTLEAQLRSSTSTLASLRHELLQVPTTSVPKDSRPVSIDQLLKYAMYISNTTVPPTFREPIPPGHAIADKERDETAIPAMAASTVGTPAQSGTAQAPVPVEDGGPDAPENDIGVTKEQAEWLREMDARGIMWKPYPDDAIVRSGNLMAVQAILDQSKDPWKEKVPTDQDLKDAAQKDKEEEEEKTQQKEEDEQRAEQEALKRKGTAAPVPGPVEPQQVQQFTGFDFGDDEDE